MDSGIYGGNDMISLLENSNNSIWVPSSSSFNGTMMNFDQEPQQEGLLNVNVKRNRYGSLLARTSDEEDTGEDESDANGYNQSDKKRRLSHEQVKYLEKSFEVENKLEPERKAELAKQLGLEPRQVAVWFQNRRARSKSKQIEKEFETLKASYFSLKDDYDALNMEKQKLQNEVEALKKKLAKKEGKETNSNIDIILQIEGGTTNIGAHGKVEETESGGLVMSSTKQAEDVSSTKSDIVDSGSPHCKDAIQSAALQVEASSALVRDLDRQPRLSPEDEEHLMISNSLLIPQSPPIFNNFHNVPEDVNYDPNANSCNFSLVDDHPFLPWLY